MLPIKNNFVLLIVIFISSCSTNKEYLPGEFFGLTLQQKLTGNKAENFVNKLHMKTVTDEKNEIGFYKGKKGEAIIYVTHYHEKKNASGEAEKMINKISPENSVFFGNEFVKIGDEKIFRCFGIGQTHYVFSNEEQLYWVTVDTHIGQEFVNEYLNYLKNI